MSRGCPARSMKGQDARKRTGNESRNTVAVLLTLYLILVFVIPLILSGAVGWRGLPRGRRCPECGAETAALRGRLVRFVSQLPTGAMIQQRWCMRCGWSGFARLPRPRLPRPGRTLDPVTQRRATRTLVVGSLAVDGMPYRVLVQCWQQAGCYFGRLVFVDSRGRLWLDAVHPIGGFSPADVIQAARGIPDRLLATRLRTLVSR